MPGNGRSAEAEAEEVIATDPRFRGWLQQRIGIELESDAQFIGIIRDNRIVAAAAFSHYTGHDIELSVAGEPGSGTKGFLQGLFQYVFDQCGCVRCTVKTRASNLPAIKLAKRLGFKHEGTMRQGFGDEDAVIFGLLKEECHGRKRRQATSRT